MVAPGFRPFFPVRGVSLESLSLCGNPGRGPGTRACRVCACAGRGLPAVRRLSPCGVGLCVGGLLRCYLLAAAFSVSVLAVFLFRAAALARVGVAVAVVRRARAVLSCLQCKCPWLLLSFSLSDPCSDSSAQPSLSYIGGRLSRQLTLLNIVTHSLLQTYM